MTTISLALVVHNDLKMLSRTLPYMRRFVDQVVIIDMNSTDGLRDYCGLALESNDIYRRRDTNTIPELGFAEARNAAAALCTSEWIIASSPNGMFYPSISPKSFKEALAGTRSPVIAAYCIHIKPPKDAIGLLEADVNFLEKELIEQNAPVSESHRRIIKNGIGVDWKGYIHEEPYLKNINAMEFSEPISAPYIHFSDWTNRQVRAWRYGWMLRNAMRNPELQKYTNSWWYTHYCVENGPLIESQAQAYEKYVAETGDK